MQGSHTARTSRTARASAAALALAAGLLGLTAGHALAAPADPLAAKGDSTFAHGGPSAGTGEANVIVTLDGPLTPDRRARIAALGGTITQDMGFIHSCALRLPARRLEALAALPFITHLSADGAVTKCDEFTVGASGAGAAFQQYGLTGKGVTVAVVDSGVRAVQDLSSPNNRVVTTVSCIPGDYNLDDACGHGTHVAGIIAGNGAASTGYSATHTFYGVARGANIVSVRVLDGNGQCSVSTAIAGIQWVIDHNADPQRKYIIRVMNLSLGHPVCESYTTDPLCQEVEAAWRAGIVVVCAAGNGGRLNTANTVGLDNEGWGTAYGSVNSPGNDPCVITVGAMKQGDPSCGDDHGAPHTDDHIATYSGRGPTVLDLVAKPDLVAPGNHVISLSSSNSTLYNNNAADGTGLPMSAYQAWGWSNYSTDYFVLSGTSMATPVVAGAAALMLQANPSLTPDTVKARLMVSADKWADPQGNADPLTYGAGYLDIPAALQSTVTVTEPALSPTLYLDGSGNLAVAMDRAIWGKRAIWGERAIWGKRAIWGSGSLTDLRAIWGKRAIWGSAADTAASRAIWGSTGVAEQRAIWGSRAIWGKSVGADRAIWGKSGAVDLSAVALHGEN